MNFGGEMKKTKSQREKILSHLNRGWPITAADALNKYGCFRLAARIKELRQAGHDITSEMVEINGSRIAKYRKAR